MLTYNLTSVLLRIINQNSEYFDKLLIIDDKKFIANNKIKLATIFKMLTDISNSNHNNRSTGKAAINSYNIKMVFII